MVSYGVAVQAANNSPMVGPGTQRKHKQAGFISRLCGYAKESEDANVPGKKWVQVFDANKAKSVPDTFCCPAAYCMNCPA